MLLPDNNVTQNNRSRGQAQTTFSLENVNVIHNELDLYDGEQVSFDSRQSFTVPQTQCDTVHVW